MSNLGLASDQQSRPPCRELSAQNLADIFTSITASRSTTAQDQAQQLINLMKELWEITREQNNLMANIQKAQQRISSQLETLNKTLSTQVTTSNLIILITNSKDRSQSTLSRSTPALHPYHHSHDNAPNSSSASI